MNKYKPAMYAEALAEALSAKKADEENITTNFLRFLEKNGDMKKAKEIIALAEQLLLKKTGNKKIIIETARKVDIKNIIKSFAKKGDAVSEKIEPNLVAGVKVIVNDETQLDYSFTSKLNNIF